ncbi:hypothetical protein FHS72_002264 [Loktanella ponticola]|uniref:Uncharacterized protein n=1 Tax=Yoonia ponticola TaxID=1524255 RepID=A0A7W9BLC0_9RHOB|nr:hypothetical protein [Yoonia ponticola]MBB5722638.1 hypothetical protein [Yoonia ponticola]
MGFVRLVVFGFIGLGVIYLSISVYSRSVRREKLEEQYDENPIANMTRREFVENGVKSYNNSFRPKLIALVFVIPPAIVAAIIYVINAN